MNDQLLSTIIPNWLTAFGTISAVIISLYLSMRDRKFKYYSKASFGTLLFPNVPGVDTFMITVVNKSPRPIKITGIIWITRKYFKHKHYFQIPDDIPLTDSLPKVLEDGQELRLYFRRDVFNNNFNNFQYRNFKLLFCTSSNEEYKIKIDKDAYKTIKLLIPK